MVDAAGQIEAGDYGDALAEESGGKFVQMLRRPYFRATAFVLSGIGTMIAADALLGTDEQKQAYLRLEAQAWKLYMALSSIRRSCRGCQAKRASMIA